MYLLVRRDELLDELTTPFVPSDRVFKAAFSESLNKTDAKEHYILHVSKARNSAIRENLRKVHWPHTNLIQTAGIAFSMSFGS